MNTRPSGNTDMPLQNMSQASGMRDEGAGDRIPDRRLVVRLGRDVARARHDQHLAVVGERDMNRIDGHQIGERAPLTDDARLGEERL